MLDDFLPGRGGGYYYADKMDEKKGQCICVSEAEHKAIHVVHDRLEKAHGAWVYTQLKNLRPSAPVS